MKSLPEILQKQLKEQGYDVMDLITVPAKGDRMVRIRTLEEALEEFDTQGDAHATSYLVQVRMTPPPAAQAAQTAPESSPEQQHQAGAQSGSVDGVYLASGRLNVPFLIRNAELLFEAGEYGLARNIFTSVLQSGEQSGHALQMLGRCHEMENRLEEARRCFEESIAYQPTIETYQRLSSLLIRCQKDREAAEVMERALHIRGLPAELRFELHKACGNCWLRAEMAKNAERNYRIALELKPDSDEIVANLGTLHLHMGQTGEAKRFFQQAVGLNPKNDRAISGIGSCYLAEGEKRQAHDHFARALDIRLNNPTAIFHLVRCAYDIRSYATAARIVGAYMEIAPVNANLMYSLAGLQFHLGRFGEARSTVQKILELQPQHSGANDLLKIIISNTPAQDAPVLENRNPAAF